MADRVRAHTRNGKPVRAHSRASRPRKALVSPGHAWSLIKRAHKASRRKKTGLAITLATLGVAEVGACLTLNSIRLVGFTAGMIFLGVAGLAAMGTGHE